MKEAKRRERIKTRGREKKKEKKDEKRKQGVNKDDNK